MDDSVNSPPPANFVDALFGRVSPEDLAAYQRDGLISFAREAWAALAVRRAGTPKIRYDSPLGQAVSVLPGSYLARDAHGVNPATNRVRVALVSSTEECAESATRIRRPASAGP